MEKINLIISAYKCAENIENLILKTVNYKIVTNDENIFDIILVTFDKNKKNKEYNICDYYGKKYKNIKHINYNSYNFKFLTESVILNGKKNKYCLFLNGNSNMNYNEINLLYTQILYDYDLIMFGEQTKNLTINDEFSNNIYNKLIKTTCINKIDKAYRAEYLCDIYKIVMNNNAYMIKRKNILEQKEYIIVDYYIKYQFYKDKYKCLNYKDDLNNMVKYGNIAYVKLLNEDKKNINKLNDIKSSYIFNKNNNIKHTYLYRKIKNGTITKNNIIVKILNALN